MGSQWAKPSSATSSSPTSSTRRSRSSAASSTPRRRSRKSHPHAESKAAIAAIAQGRQGLPPGARAARQAKGATGKVEDVAEGIIELLESLVEKAGEAPSEAYEAHAVLLNAKRKQQDSAGGMLRSRAPSRTPRRVPRRGFEKGQKATSDQLRRPRRIRGRHRVHVAIGARPTIDTRPDHRQPPPRAEEDANDRARALYPSGWVSWRPRRPTEGHAKPTDQRSWRLTGPPTARSPRSGA